jgi:hypothetical protein
MRTPSHSGRQALICQIEGFFQLSFGLPLPGYADGVPLQPS